MKLRNKIYMRRKKAVQDMIRFTDITSFLKATFEISRSLVVKQDILRTMAELRGTKRQNQLAYAS